MADITKVTIPSGTTYNIKDASIYDWARASAKPTYTCSEVGAVAFDDSYITNANTFYSVNGYSKTSTSTTNLPSVCTGSDRWGVIFFIAENATNHTGTQMYFPIDGTYKGRIFYRSMVSGTPSSWLLIPLDTDISGKQDASTLETDVKAFITKSYIEGLLDDGDSVSY